MIDNRYVCISNTNIRILVIFFSISITDIWISIKDIWDSKNYIYLYLLKEISVFKMQVSGYILFMHCFILFQRKSQAVQEFRQLPPPPPGPPPPPPHHQHSQYFDFKIILKIYGWSLQCMIKV